MLGSRRQLTPARQFPQQGDAVFNIRRPFRLVWLFAFDAQHTPIAHFLQLMDEPFHSHAAFTQRLLLAQRRWPIARRPIAIFAVNGNHMAGQYAQRFNRVARAVKNHIGWVEIDFEVHAFYVFNEPQQNLRLLWPVSSVNDCPFRAQ